MGIPICEIGKIAFNVGYFVANSVKVNLILILILRFSIACLVLWLSNPSIGVSVDPYPSKKAFIPIGTNPFC